MWIQGQDTPKGKESLDTHSQSGDGGKGVATLAWPAHAATKRGDHSMPCMPIEESDAVRGLKDKLVYRDKCQRQSP